MRRVTKASLQKEIWNYESRKKTYREAIKKIHKKLYNLNRRLKKFEKRDLEKERIVFIERCLYQFSGVRLKDYKGQHGKAIAHLRGIFCKFCLEEGLSYTEICKNLGLQTNNKIYRTRSNFNKILNSNKEVFNLYHKFKKHVKEQEKTN